MSDLPSLLECARPLLNAASFRTERQKCGAHAYWAARSHHAARPAGDATLDRSVSQASPALTVVTGAFWKLHLSAPDPSLQAKGVKLAVERADVKHPIRHGGRGRLRPAGAGAPQLGAGLGIQRVHVDVK